MNLKLKLLVLFLFLSWQYTIRAQEIRVGAKLDSPAIKLGAQTKLRLSVHLPVEKKIIFPVIADSIGKIEIIGTGITDTIFDKENVGSATVLKTFTVTSFDPGSHSVPRFKFELGDSIFTSPALQLTVQPVTVDTTKGIYDIKQPIKVTYTFLDWFRDNWHFVVLALLTVGLIIVLIKYLKKRPPAEFKVEEKIVIPAHTVALEKLKDLQEKKLWQQDLVKQHHSELSDIVREYLENRFAINALEQTTDEIFMSLRRSSISGENKENLRNILVLADLVKFAKQKPVAFENESSVESAIRFVEETKLSVKPVENGEIK